MRLTVCVSPARLEPTGHGDASAFRTPYCNCSARLPWTIIDTLYVQIIDTTTQVGLQSNKSQPRSWISVRPHQARCSCGLGCAAARAAHPHAAPPRTRARQPAPGRGAGAHRGIIGPASRARRTAPRLAWSADDNRKINLNLHVVLCVNVNTTDCVYCTTRIHTSQHTRLHID